MARRKKGTTLADQIGISPPIMEALLPLDGQVNCPKRGGASPLYLQSCILPSRRMCKFSKGMGPFVTVRCSHSKAKEVEKEWHRSKTEPKVTQETLF